MADVVALIAILLDGGNVAEVIRLQIGDQLKSDDFSYGNWGGL
jgi:hypothetical protein